MPLGGTANLRRPVRRARSILAAAALLAALAVPGAAQGKVIWRIRGGGFGHGVGMSQYGAYGYATHGTGYKAILTHYFSHTKVATTSDQTVRVLLRPYQSQVSFNGATAACDVSLSEARTYSGVRSGGDVLLRNPKGKTIENCGPVLSATGGKSVVMVGKGSYRGALEVRPSSVPKKVNAINAVALDDYVKGVVPRESPSSWPMEALKAQAVAARSYGLAGKVGGNGFDLYDNTSSQVYGGLSAETSRSNKAVNATALQIVNYKGQVAKTFFFSTSGGYTENNENVFGGEPIPYLRGVPDPYDGISPYHRWVVKKTQRRIQIDLGDAVRGKLRKITVLKRGVSPRIVTAKLIGSTGVTKIAGQALRADLGLRDAPWGFKRIERK
jgi:stage II sporulation protein D